MADPPASSIATNTANGALISQPDSVLMNLAAELRNAIYELVLVSDEPICVLDPTDKQAKDQVALLYTCRQVRAEATAIYYSNNTFRGCIGRAPLGRTDESIMSTCVFTWLKNIGPSNIGLVRRLELGWVDHEALCRLSQTYDGFSDPWVSHTENYINDVAACHIAMLKSLGLSQRVIPVARESWTETRKWRDDNLDLHVRLACLMWAARMMLLTGRWTTNALISGLEVMRAQIKAIDL